MNLLKLLIEDLRPTQKCVGLLEVEAKTKKISKMSHEERDAFLLANPIPVVKGFHSQLYVIDHHHLARAMLEAGHAHVMVKVLEELVSLEHEAFWSVLQKKHFIYLKDAHGKDITPADIPKKITDLKDDPYRSLAGFVRKAGGYDKNPSPFAEFQWACFFRDKIKFDNTQKCLEKILPQALKLAQSAKAQGLPGFKEE